MNNKIFLVFIEFFFLFDYIYCYSNGENYYQLIDEFSFNLKDISTHSNILNNYKLIGYARINDKNLILNDDVSNSFGYLYTKGEILTNQIELQIKFKKQNNIGPGALNTIWIFKSLKEKTNKINSFFGFEDENLNAIGIVFYTPPQNNSMQRTYIYVIQNDGTNKLTNLGFNNFRLDNSCNEIFLNRSTKFTIIIDFNVQNIYIKYDSDQFFINNCLDNFRIDYKPPVRVGFSAINGNFDDKEFLNNILIEKVSIFNMNKEFRSNYTNLEKLNDQVRFF